MSTTVTAGRAVNYDARTVVLRELKHAAQAQPGRFVGVFTYERLRRYGATYAEG